MHPPTLQTSRLILRALTLDDAPAIYAYAKDPEMTHFTMWEPHTSVEDSQEFIKNYAFQRYMQGVPDPYGIVLKSQPDIVIGTVGCYWNPQSAYTMELAYSVARAHWGNGIVTEASQKIIEHCMQNYPVKRLFGKCMVKNAASLRVIEKLGMKPEGTLRASLFRRNQFWDMHYFSIIRPDDPVNPGKSEIIR